MEVIIYRFNGSYNGRITVKTVVCWLWKIIYESVKGRTFLYEVMLCKTWSYMAHFHIPNNILTSYWDWINNIIFFHVLTYWYLIFVYIPATCQHLLAEWGKKNFFLSNIYHNNWCLTQVGSKIFPSIFLSFFTTR